MAAPSTDLYREGLRLSAQGRYPQAVTQFERALARRPDDPRVLFALASTARAMGNRAIAEKFYARVLALEPGRLEAVVCLSNLMREDGRFAQAEEILAQALRSTPEAAELWLGLGTIYRETGNDEQAIVFYRHALELKSRYIPAMGNLADILSDRGQTDEALALYASILKAEPRNVQARFHRATIHLTRGALEAGWKDYAARLDERPNTVPLPDHRLRRWNGKTRPGLHLLVSAEQGIGDQVMFASLLPELATALMQVGGRLFVDCEPRLASLLARIPGLEAHPWQIEFRDGLAYSHVPWLKEAGGADAFVEMGTLPAFLRPTIDTFPSPHAYFIVDTAERDRWQTRFADLPRPLIGACWRSGKGGGQRNRQYAPLQAWGDFLAAVPGTVVVTQYDAAPDEIAALEAMAKRSFAVPAALDQKNEIDRTVAMLAGLDVVVSAPTAVSWLAAAAGVPTVKVLGCPTWTSFATTYEPFAPAARCAVPELAGDWTGAFAHAHRLLQTFLTEAV